MLRRSPARFLTLLFLVLASAGIAFAQTNSYTQTNLSCDTAGTAAFTSPDLSNPWGIAFIPGNPFWISDNNSGKAILYDKTGTLLGNFTIPPPHGSSHPPTPTGIVANTQGGFNVAGVSSVFIFATEDGTISGWYPTISTAILAVDNSTKGAVYKGLAMVSTTTLLATNFNSGAVEAYDTNFNPVTLAGSFTDPTLPSGFAPFGIHVIGTNQLLVTYAQQDAAKHDPVHAAGAGYVSLFDTQGNFVRRVASQGKLNAPWGATIAPSTFGTFQGALLIGNFVEAIGGSGGAGFPTRAVSRCFSAPSSASAAAAADTAAQVWARATEHNAGLPPSSSPRHPAQSRTPPTFLEQFNNHGEGLRPAAGPSFSSDDD